MWSSKEQWEIDTRGGELSGCFMSRHEAEILGDGGEEKDVIVLPY